MPARPLINHHKYTSSVEVHFEKNGWQDLIIVTLNVNLYRLQEKLCSVKIASQNSYKIAFFQVTLLIGQRKVIKFENVSPLNLNISSIRVNTSLIIKYTCLGLYRRNVRPKKLLHLCF